MILVRQMLQGKTADVWTIRPDATVYEALELMADKDVGALPVAADGQLVGMFSERDYARKIVLLGKSSQNTPVRDLMSHPVFSVGPQESLEACMELMTNRHIRHLPVIDNYSLIGVISIRDISTAFDDEATAEARSVPA